MTNSQHILPTSQSLSPTLLSPVQSIVVSLPLSHPGHIISLHPHFSHNRRKTPAPCVLLLGLVSRSAVSRYGSRSGVVREVAVKVLATAVQTSS